MKTKRLICLLMTLAMLLSLLPAVSAAGEASWVADIPAMLAAGPYAEGEVIVGVDPAYADGFDLLLLMGLKEDLEGEDLMTVPAEEASAGEAVLTLISRPDKTTEELLYALAGDSRVVFAEPNYRFETPESASEGDMAVALGQAAEAVSREGGVSLQGESDADRWDGVASHDQIADLTDFQWGHKAVHTPSFGTGTGNMTGEPIVVAVIDCPVDFSHPDLAPVAFTFTEEQQEALSCDEHGFNALSEDGKLELAGADPHGTHVAGIIGAAWDGYGICGVASNVRIVSCQCSTDGSFYYDSAVRCFAFVDRANEAGANIRITNNSWCGYGCSLIIDAAVRALGERWGVVSVFAAGNSGRDWKDYGFGLATMAKNPYAVLVAAADPTEELASFSCYNGDMVTLVAPGAGILSTVQPEEAWYIPDATPGSNSFYESFEGEDFRVTVVQEAPESKDADNEDGENPDSENPDSENPDNENQNNENQNNENADQPVRYTVTTERAMTGSHALELKLDQDKMKSLPSDDRYESCLLQLTLHDVGEVSGQYLGLSFYGSSLVYIPQCKWPDGSKPDMEGMWGSDNHTWGTIWTDVPEEAVSNGELTITLRLIVKQGTADTIWFDSVGLGNEKVPYQYMNGTSQACPLVAGAAAVLAAQTGEIGPALVNRIKATVRQTDALRDKVATGGILDFAVSGAIPLDREPGTAWPLYDTRLPLDVSTGDDPFDYDAQGDWETSGPLVGLGDKLYYLPNMTDHGDYGVLLAFNPAARIWETLSPLPEPIYNCSAAAFDDKLVVKGNTEMDPDAEETKAVVWVYDPADDSWTEANAEGVLVRQTIIAGENGLLLAGSGKMDPETGELEPAVLASYDPETGAGTGRALQYGYEYPRAVAKEGAVYLFCASDYSLVKVTEDGEEDLTYTLPDYRAMHLDPDEFNSYDEYTERDGVLLATDEGLLLVGVLSEDGAADTWLLREGAEQFEPLMRKTCLTRPFYVAAEVLQGKVYAIGVEWNEDAPRFFRANDLATLNEPIPAPTPSHSGGGGGAAPVANPVTVPSASSAAAAHGSVKPNASNAKAGDTVILTPEPEEGYVTAGVTVTDKNGNNVPVTRNADGTYSFVMPATAVTVSPVFTAATEPADPNNPDPAPTGDVSDRFVDVSRDAWYHDAVQWAVDKGLMNGVSEDTFAPNETCTRAMVVTMLWRLAGEPVVNYALPYTDVPEDTWYTEAVRWAASAGAVNGTSETTFDPNTPVTREQLATILYRYAQAQGKGFTGAWMFLLDYPDADQVSDWANEAMHWMTMHGIITGMGDGTLAPQANATRAQIATMFMRFCEELET